MAEIIMGIDHGNGNMKGVHVNFPCGLVRYTSEPGRFMNEDILEYNGVYYTLSETRMPFKADKTVDEDYFILTLFSLALEAKERGITLSGKDIVLGVGLPPADFGQQAPGFKKYFTEHSKHGISFRFNKEEAETVRLCYYLFLNGFPTAEIAEILMQLKRKTKLGNTKWSSGTVGSLLKNERYCGDVLSRKTFTPNYLDHKSKKNRHDRNQYRQTNHHEAIVDRDIYNAAQKMLTVTKYAKKGFPFPNLKVVDGGALKGFVSVNRSWTGFTVEDYKKASQSVYSDQNSIQDIEESKEEKRDGGFDLSGYEIVRAQFFSTRLNPAMTISEGRITFNTACLKKFEDVEYVEILFNSIERCIAVRPCDRDNINAVKWGTIRNGKWAVLPKSCRGFSEPLFELMDWNNECKYRFRGQYSKEDNEQILLFDLEEPEVIKHEIIQEDLPDTDTTEAEKNTVETSENKTKKIVRTLFPKQWQNHFGDSSEDVVLLHRVKYCGNWDVLRPAKIVEGLEPISENLLDKLNEEAQNMIEKMRCAV